MCKQEFDRLREEIKQLNKDNKDSNTQKGTDQKEIHTMLTALDSSVKSAHHRISGMEKHTEAVIRLSVSVDNVVEQISSVLEMYGDLEGRTSTLENRPAQTVYGYFQIGVATVITGIIGVVIGALLSDGGVL